MDVDDEPQQAQLKLNELEKNKRYVITLPGGHKDTVMFLSYVPVAGWFEYNAKRAVFKRENGLIYPEKVIINMDNGTLGVHANRPMVEKIEPYHEDVNMNGGRKKSRRRVRKHGRSRKSRRR